MDKKPSNRQSEKVGGDKNLIQGNISGGIVVQGRNAKINVQHTNENHSKALTELFEKLYEAVEARAEDPNVDKEEINETIQKIEKESKEDEQANETKLERWLENLNKMAPDLVDVILASLGGPVSGFTAILKKVAERARQKAGGSA